MKIVYPKNYFHFTILPCSCAKEGHINFEKEKYLFESGGNLCLNGIL